LSGGIPSPAGKNGLGKEEEAAMSQSADGKGGRKAAGQKSLAALAGLWSAKCCTTRDRARAWRAGRSVGGRAGSGVWRAPGASGRPPVIVWPRATHAAV